MTTAELFFLAVVVLVGIPAMRWNLTAVGLVTAYASVQVIYYATGEPLPTLNLVLLDLWVMAVIYMKEPAYDCFPYRSLAHQLACFWLERSWADRIILSLFPAAWYFYGIGDARLQWWGLYAVSLAQFVVAGGEALHTFFSPRAANADQSDAPEPPPGAEFAGAGIGTHG